MNLDTHNKYFRDIAYNTNKNVSWRQEPERYKEVEQKAYEYRVEELIKSCKHLQSASELSNYKGNKKISVNIFVNIARRVNYMT